MRTAHWLAIVAFAVLAVVRPTAAGDAQAPHKLTGQYVEFCSCERFCDGALTDVRRAPCNAVIGLRIEAGQRADISLGGISAVVVTPAELKTGMAPALYVDRVATDAQASAIREILNERLAPRTGAPLGPARRVAVDVRRTTDALTISVEGVAELRAHPWMGLFNRPVQLENLPGNVLHFPCLGRGTAGQVTDPALGVRFDAEGRSVFFGKFDFGGGKRGKKP